MKITRWQMFVAWLKRYATIDRFLALMFLISIFFHGINNAILNIVVSVIQIILLICFIKFSMYKNLTKKQLAPFIVSICIYTIVLEILKIIYGCLETINFLIILVAVVLGVVVFCCNRAVIKHECKIMLEDVDEVFIGYSEDKLHRYVVSLKNGMYEVHFEKFVQETLYNGEEYSDYEPIDLDNTALHIFDEYKKAKEYGEQVLKDIKLVI